MLHAQVFVQFYFFPGSCQPVTQLDVLDRWVAIAIGVESPGLNESLSAHRTPAGPESNRSLAGLEVHVAVRSEEHTSELQSPDHLVCRLLLEKKKKRHHGRVGDPGNPTPPSCSTLDAHSQHTAREGIGQRANTAYAPAHHAPATTARGALLTS